MNPIKFKTTPERLQKAVSLLIASNGNYFRVKMKEGKVEETILMEVLESFSKKVMSKVLKQDNKSMAISLKYYQAYYLEKRLRENFSFFPSGTWEHNTIRDLADIIHQQL